MKAMSVAVVLGSALLTQGFAAEGTAPQPDLTPYILTPAAQAKLFQRFFRAKVPGTEHITGTGLGLSLVKDTIEAINGRITVESAPGRGSAFTLHLQPARDEKT